MVLDCNDSRSWPSFLLLKKVTLVVARAVTYYAESLGYYGSIERTSFQEDIARKGVPDRTMQGNDLIR